MSDRRFDQGGFQSSATASEPRAGVTAEQRTRLVQSSFQRVLPIAGVAAELFYGRLFLLDPSLRPMFKGDIVEQGRKLMKVLQVAVHGLDRLDQIVPVVEALGARHAGYGVRPEHYDTVREALVWMLRRCLGSDFTPAVATAWTEVYELLAGVMKGAAAKASAKPPTLPPPSRAPLSSRAPVSSRRMPLSQPPPS
jgi:hemoglobin-like flavoprotein